MPRQKNQPVKYILNAGDARQINEAITILKGYEGILSELGSQIAPVIEVQLKAKHIVPMLIKLRTYPEKPKYPLKWKSEKQRRYVMMLLKRKAVDEGHPDDIAYRRTGKLKRGWRYELVTDKKTGSVKLKVWNDAESYDPIKGITTKYARFVVGDIGLGVSQRSIERYRQPIQPFHADRWNPAFPTIQEAFQGMMTDAGRLYEQHLGNKVDSIRTRYVVKK